MRSYGRGFFITLLVLFSLYASAAEGARIKVLILPFDMHSKEDISRLRKEVMEALASSLYDKGVDITGIERIKELVLEKGVKSFDEESALKISEEVPSDFALLGSISKLGRTYEVDIRALDLRENRLVTFLSRTASSRDALVERTRRSASVLYERLTAALKARPAVKEGVITTVRIEGNRRVDAEAVLSKLKSHAGEPFSRDTVNEDIRSIYGMGYFEDVTVDLSDTASGKVLTFRVREKPFIKSVELDGNDKVSDDKIRDVLTVKKNMVLDMSVVKENAEKIKALYEKEGYYLAEVTPEVSSDGVEAQVTYRIKEGDRVRVKRITIIGNKVFTDKELKKLMRTKEAWLFSFLTGSGKFDEFFFQNDLARIMGHYFDNGYIDVDIVDHRVLLSRDRRWFYITIALKEGEQYRVGSVDIEGDLLAPKEELLEKLGLKSGEVFNRSRLTSGIDALDVFYGDKGYANAEIVPKTRVDRRKRIIDLKVNIKKNELVYIERIEIRGNVRTRDKVIRRELEVREGDLYSATGLKKSRNNLRRLGYFEDVKITETSGTSKDKMKIDIEVAERPTGSISVGMGYSSVDKLIGTASIAQSNFMGTGIKLDISGTISASSSRYILGFTEPWLFDKPISAGFDLFNIGREYPDFTMDKKGFALRSGFPIYKRDTYGFLTYRYERVDVTDVSDTATEFIKSQEGTTTISSIKGQVRRDTRNDAFFPTEGSVVSLSAELAGGFLGGSSNFVKTEANAVRYFPMPFNTVFSIRCSAGYIASFAGKDVPIFEKYFLGGINSLRGFETREVGPKDPVTKEFIGGETMFVSNFEFLFPLMGAKDLKGVLFFDTGNAYDGPIDFGDLRYSTGLGIRWFSPLGPLRLEWGYNLDRREGEKQSQWEFAVGTAF